MSTAFLESRPLTFAVIGDSAAFGTGDSAPDGTMRGWAYYLANCFKDQTNYLNFSRPGAKSAEVSGATFKGNRSCTRYLCSYCWWK